MPCFRSKPPLLKMCYLILLAFKMADHWVAEVFPPKFQFGSAEEMLISPVVDDREKEKTNLLDEVYRKVYCEQEKARDEELNSRRSTSLDKRQAVSRVRREREGKHESKPQKEEEDECIWNQSELKMLRKFLQKAKMQNLRLAAMLQSTQNEISIWKEKYKVVAESDAHVKNRLLILKKKYERLKVNYRALKDDVRRYHANLKVTRGDLEELKTEKNEIEKTLSQTKSELNREKLDNEQLQSRLDRKEREFEENMKNCEYFLEQQHQIEKAKLQKEIDRLSKEYEKEKEDNNLNKKALEHLRSHFANLQMNQDNTGETKVIEQVLSVIYIDYLPK